jgi:hypothetical protein
MNCDMKRKTMTVSELNDLECDRLSLFIIIYLVNLFNYL